MTVDRCTCMECRIREAIGSGRTISGLNEVDTGQALRALGEVASELLAHYPTRDAKAFASALLEARKRWQREPRVMVQQKTEGIA